MKANINRLDLSLDDLKGRQSVRATFRLPKQVIDLLSVMAVQLGIKQKSLFDQLVEDTGVLRKIAEEAQSYNPEPEKRRQKTFVISRNSLLALNLIAKKEQVARDILVEYSIKRLLPVIESELEKHERRKVLLREMEEYLEHGQKILAKAGKLLGTNDRLYDMIEQHVTISERNVAILKGIVQKGKPMEEW